VKRNSIENVEEEKRSKKRVKEKRKIKANFLFHVYPIPQHLKDYIGDDGKRKINIGISGTSGAGKSTLINALRGLGKKDRKHPDYAKTGVSECTMEATPYKFPGNENILIWDLPGGGTKLFPEATYVRDMGLRYFDCVLVLSYGRIREVEVRIMENLVHFNVPCYPIRNKVDQDIQNNDDDLEEEELIANLRRDTEEKLRSSRVYLISAKDLDREGLDGRILYNYIIESIRNETIRLNHIDQLYLNAPNMHKKHVATGA